MTKDIQNLLDKYNRQFDGISVYISESTSKSVQLDGFEVETADYADSRTCYVRCMKAGKLLTSAITGAGSDAIESFLKEGADTIGSMPADSNRLMPAFAEPYSTLNLYDTSFGNVTVEMLTDIAKEVTSAAMEADKRVKAVKQSSASASVSRSTLISTSGPVLSSERTVFSAGAYLIASGNGDERDGYDYVSSVLKSDLDYRLSAQSAAENACSLLGAKQIKSGKYHIVFSAAVMADFLELLLDLTDGENVYKGLSLLAGKKGSIVASEGFTLTDDPGIQNGLGSRAYDDEGQNCNCVDIIKNGTLKNYLHNSYTAKALNDENNARAVITGGGNISVGCTNVSVATTTDKKPADFASEYLMVTEVMGMHTADPVSGNFSVGISGLHFIDGTTKNPFREAVISGNLTDLLSGMIHIFDNRRTFGNITTADTLFDKMSVSGV